MVARARNPDALKRTERASPRDLAWLRENLRGSVEALFTVGECIPQKFLGTLALAASKIHF